MDTVLTFLGLAVIGFAAGTVNTIAGGGSLLTLPALIFFGLPAGVANGTNRLGVIVQSAVATWRFQRAGVLQAGTAARMVAPMLLGAVVGAIFSTEIDDGLFTRIIGGAMLVMAAATIIRPRRWFARWSLHPDRAVWRATAEACMLLGLGLYAGFLQAGVGVFALAVIAACRGLDLVRANAIKACLVLVITAPALIIFLWKDLVAWGPGLSVACGQVVGGWVGARLTMQRGASFVRWVVVCVVCVSATKLLGLW